MNYAKIKDNLVENVVFFHWSQAHEFPDCIELGDIPAGIGDEYINGKFYRNGKEVKTNLQHAQEQIISISKAALTSTAEACAQTNTEPKANVGLFIEGAEDWEVGKTYNRFDLVRYNGSIAWVKQAHTSQEAWLPFSVGTESLYGARPAPDEEGVYPYVYNMAVEVGMKVRYEDIIYECIQATDSLLYNPSEASSLFRIL